MKKQTFRCSLCQQGIYSFPTHLQVHCKWCNKLAYLVELEQCHICCNAPVHAFGPRISKHNACLHCKYEIDKIKARDQIKKNYKAKVQKELVERACKKCDKKYMPLYADQYYCNNPCTAQLTYAERWLARQTEEEKRNSMRARKSPFKHEYSPRLVRRKREDNDECYG